MTEAPTNLSASTPSLAGLRVLVVGLGRFGGGVGATRWLAAQGAEVTVTDRANRDDLTDSLEQIAGLSIRLSLGGHDPKELQETDLVVVNPAIDKRKSEFFGEIVLQRIPWTTETNLFCERCHAPVIGVTGSYGKSTTCAMLAHSLESGLGRPGVEYTGVYLGGNIGRSLLADLPRIKRTDLVILELSSSQLEDLPRINWAPKLAVITNISPHHVDRYTSHDEYIRAKTNVFGNVEGVAAAIIGHLDQQSEAVVEGVARTRRIRILRVPEPSSPVELRVPGAHNRANAACVLAICHHLGLSEAVALEALHSFRGLPHRLEHIRTLDGVDYYNDSKSTSPSATIRAVESFDRPIIAIVGGLEKPVSLESFAPALTRACRKIICIGESGPTFATALQSATTDKCPDESVIESDGLEQAVRQARAIAQPGDLILFSPGAPSFDQYPNFTVRGKHFVTLVNDL